jgi:hypothetical protein
MIMANSTHQMLSRLGFSGSEIQDPIAKLSADKTDPLEMKENQLNLSAPTNAPSAQMMNLLTHCLTPNKTPEHSL